MTRKATPDTQLHNDSAVPSADSLNFSQPAAEQQTTPGGGGGTLPVATGEATGDMGGRPEQIGPYTITGLLGEGGMGVVYRGFDSRLRRDAAIKTIRCSARQQDFADRLNREARLLAQLNHPHIVRILDLGEDAGRTWLAMELLPGRTLADEIRAGATDARRAAEWVLQIAEAVGYCHTAGIIHRDLKPANVLIADDGQLKVTDFGLGRSADNQSRLTRSGDVVGTLQYMAPEQATGAVRQIRPASDVYAIGVILYELLTGAPPFLDADPLRTITRILTEDVKSLRASIPEIPVQLETICLKCLEKSPTRRYADANQVAADLQRFLSNVRIEARPVGQLQQCVRWIRRHPLITTVALSALGFLITWSAVVASHNRRLTRELERSQRLVNNSREFATWLLYDFNDQLEDPRGLTAIRTDLVQGIAGYLAKASPDSKGDPRLQLELSRAWIQAAALQGNPSGFNMGLLQAALASLTQAEHLLDEIPAESEYASEVLRLRAVINEQRGDLAGAQEETVDARKQYVEGIARLSGLPPGDERFNEKVGLLRCRLNVSLGEMALGSQNFGEAHRYLDAAAAALTTVSAQSSTERVSLDAIRAQVFDAEGRYEEGVALWKDIAVRLKAARGPDDHVLMPGTTQPLINALLGQAGLLLKMGEPDQAQGLYDEALSMNASILQRDPLNQLLRRERAIILRDRAVLDMGYDRVTDVTEDMLKQSLELFTQLLDEQKTDQYACEDVMSALGFLGSLETQLQQPDQAEELLKRQETLALELIERRPDRPSLLQARAEAVMGLALVCSLRMSMAIDRNAEAEAAGTPSDDEAPFTHLRHAIDLFQRSVELFEELRRTHGWTESQEANAANAAKLLQLHKELLVSFTSEA